MKLGYADPPYPGLAHYYKDHPDYVGELDHVALIQRLETEFDGWVLHTSSNAIPLIAALVPSNARWGAWVKSWASFKPGNYPAYAWEPVIFKPMRKVTLHRDVGCILRDWVEAPITMKRGLTGAKPQAVCHWAFEVVGAEPGDELVDLFYGTGAVTAAWECWRPQLSLFKVGV